MRATAIRGALVAFLLPLSLGAGPGTESEKDIPVREYRRVLEKNPSDRDVRHRVATRLTELKRFPEARVEYETLHASGPTDAIAAYGLGLVMMSQADWSALDTLLTSLPPAITAARAADFARLWNNLGVSQERANPTRAATSYQRSVDLAPERIGTRIALALVHLSTGNADAAMAALEKVTAPPDDQKVAYCDAAAAISAHLMEKDRLEEAKAWLARAQGIETKSPPYSVNFNVALLAYKQGRIADARAAAYAFAPATVPAPHRPALAALLYNLALSAHEAGDGSAAQADLGRALLIAPQDEPSLLLLSQIQEASGRWAAAVKNAKRCVDLAPENLECRVAYADAFIEAKRGLGKQAEEAVLAGNYAAALAAYAEALSVDPGDEILRERAKVIEGDQARAKKMDEEYQRALDAGNWDLAADVLLGLTKTTPKNLNHAKREAELQAKLEKDRKALRARALAQEKQGKLYKAFETWTKLAQVDATAKAAADTADAAWKTGLAGDRKKATALNAAGKYGEARALLLHWSDQGLKDSTLDAQIKTLGNLLAAKTAAVKQQAEKEATAGNWQGAQTAYASALAIDPRDESAKAGKDRADAFVDPGRGANRARELYSDGVILYTRGQYDEAISKWDEVLRLPGSGEWAQRSKAHIDRAKRILELAAGAKGGR